MPEKTSEISYIQVQNLTEQNARQAGDQLDFGNNLPLTPSIADLNRITTAPPQGGGGEIQGHRPQPAFGVHIREAVAIVKDWAR